MQTEWYKRGVSWPPLGATITLNRSGNLTGCTVAFRMLSQDGTVVVDNAATVLDASAGTIQYTWQPSDLANEGNYWAEFWVTLPGSEIVKLPVDDYINIVVKDDLT